MELIFPNWLSPGFLEHLWADIVPTHSIHMELSIYTYFKQRQNSINVVVRRVFCTGLGEEKSTFSSLTPHSREEANNVHLMSVCNTWNLDLSIRATMPQLAIGPLSIYSLVISFLNCTSCPRGDPLCHNCNFNLRENDLHLPIIANVSNCALNGKCT